jgi:hypothetical protein
LSAVGVLRRVAGLVQVTALGNPALLERMSGALLEIRALFAAGDTDGEELGQGQGGGHLGQPG